MEIGFIMESDEILTLNASREMYAKIIALAGVVLTAEERTKIIVRFIANRLRLEIEGDQDIAQRLLLAFENAT